MHLYFSTELGHSPNLFEVRKVKRRINTLRGHVQRHRHNVQVSCTFAIAKQRALDAIGAR